MPAPEWSPPPPIVWRDPYVALDCSANTRIYLEDFGGFQWLRIQREGAPAVRVRWDELTAAYEALMAENGRPVS